MGKPTVWVSGGDFERDVTRIARALWPNAGIGGALVLNGRERDGVYITEDAVHLVECTTSRTMQKAVDDINKSVKLSRDLRRQHPDKAVQCWFITADEPTPDQRSVATKVKEVRVHAVSYDIFRTRLINASSYLAHRRDYAFGSARNLSDGSAKINRSEYVELDLLRLADSALFSTKDISEYMLLSGMKRIVILGDYGAGKSMTLHEIYLKVADAYSQGRTPLFPVYINLRDHSGQQEPVEVLERHARRVGFDPPHHLVRAWRAGFVVLILDGFDELSTTGWIAFNRRLKDTRFSTVEAVRRFVRETPPEAPVIVAGRVSYFDEEKECLNALGIKDGTASVLSLNDFTEEQISRYLRKLGIEGTLPAWLPSRPLLIGALASRGALGAGVIGDESVEPGEGWENLLRAVCEREAATHEVVDAETIREVIEQLASIARAKGGLTAPLPLRDMASAYMQVRGIEPDERVQTLLLRLPGLGRAVEGDDARAFVDIDFASAASAGDVTRFIDNPFGMSDRPIQSVKEVLQEVGVAVALSQLVRKGIPSEKVYVALHEAVKQGDVSLAEHGLAVDLAKIVVSGSIPEPRNIQQLTLREVSIEELDLTDTTHAGAGLTFKQCLISTLYLPENAAADNNLPKFIQCELEHVDGRVDETNLAASMFKDCTFGTFSATLATNAAVMDARDLEPGVKVLVTVLRKLFLQKGAGRKQNAFYRGIGGASGTTTKIVDKILDSLENADFARPTKQGGAERVWYPNRRLAARAKAIVANPKGSKESLVSIARNIN